uniref:NADH dehydrogenase subunit 3 n=1 Tax=Euclimacia badia TaxID=2448034 RepID=UPI000EF32AD6|nr:NADH dehydrogenase subunit 3 [Euclimacia badia]AYG51277.1 NADH dehydrogenase subunit 3 [Euclimacia badia]
MMLMLSISMMIMFIAMITMIIASILSKKSFYDREKNSPFECGFDPKSSARMPFSLHFFLIAIIFLIFDVEIALLLPSILTLNISNINMWIFTLSFFISILLLGLYYEWKEGALNWTY